MDGKEVMKNLYQKFWNYVFYLAYSRCRGGWGACGNRTWKCFRVGGHDIEVVVFDIMRPNGNERTEIYRMLKSVREQEIIQDWKCPEPVLDGRVPPIHVGH